MTVYPARRRFTVDEYYRMADAGILCEDDRVELIEGEVIQMPPIGSPHSSRVIRLTHRFVPAFGARAQIIVQGPVRLNDHSEPVPDVAVARPRLDYYAGGHPSPADVLLVVEVSDTTLRYDTRVKLPIYARNDVPEVWIEDLKGDVIRVFREPGPSGYGVSFTRGRGERISPLAFADIEFAVDELLG